MKRQSGIERDAHDARGQPFSGNGGGATASDHNQGQGSFLRRVSIFGAAGAIAVALMGLLGYVPGLGLLGSVREGYIPIAPSTAISFIVLGSILLAMTLRSPSGASLVLFGALAALVSLFGALDIAGHFTGWDLNFEDALVPSAGYLGEIPVARMSPSTGALFLLAGLAVSALVLRRSRSHRRGTRLGHWGGILGSLVLGIGLLFCLAYLNGSPLLYGRGATVPMALTTALAFLMLGGATVGASGKDAIPLSLLAGAKLSDKHISVRKRFAVLALIMIVACGMVMSVMSLMLYRHDVQENREMLHVTVTSQARLIEAIARYNASAADAMRDKDPEHDASAATLSQIIDSHERYVGFGETGEFTLARREGNSIVFVLRHRYGAVGQPAPVAFDSDLAEPMRRALEGLSGTMIGLDYRGETVLAAHEPVAEMGLGIVAKIDLTEIRMPFIRSAFTAAAVALIVVLGGTTLFFRIANPIIARLEAYSRDLEKEVAERTAQLEAANKELAVENIERKHAEDQFRLVIEASTFGILIMAQSGQIVLANTELERQSGYKREELIGQPIEILMPERYRPGHPDRRDGFFKNPEVKKFGVDRDLYCRHKDGSEYPVEFDISPIEGPEGRQALAAFADITERKNAKKKIIRLNEDLRHKTVALEAANKELEAFSYSVSHDLRAPLRSLDGFSQVLVEDYADRLDEEGKGHLKRIQMASRKMDQLIDDLLSLSRMTRSKFERSDVDLSNIATTIVRELQKSEPERRVEFSIEAGLVVRADANLLQILLENLLRNAWKFSRNNECARIEFGTVQEKGPVAYFVRDNGAGFDMDYVDKLFGVFQRLHRVDEFEGTGIGLATVQRIVNRHGGRAWAEGMVDQGATFYFTLA